MHSILMIVVLLLVLGGVSYYLCGHTHRRQVLPANLVTAMTYTVDYGYYRVDTNSPQVIVSSGVGAWGMPMRVGTDCEIVTVRFFGTGMYAVGRHALMPPR